jgi:hypothetical protein
VAGALRVAVASALQVAVCVGGLDAEGVEVATLELEAVPLALPLCDEDDAAVANGLSLLLPALALGVALLVADCDADSEKLPLALLEPLAEDEALLEEEGEPAVVCHAVDVCSPMAALLKDALAVGACAAALLKEAVAVANALRVVDAPTAADAPTVADALHVAALVRVALSVADAVGVAGALRVADALL